MLRIKTLSRHLILGLLASAFLLATAQSANAQSGPAAAYCKKNGGVVQTRYPASGTNDPNPVRLAGTAQFCQFTSPTDGSRINVRLETLYTQQPSLAAKAYLKKTPFSGERNGANPSSIYCQQIGGTTRFSTVISAAGGGWVLESNSQDVISFCVFSDLSMIDAWGLLYHTDGTVRGKDLTTVLRYRPTTLHDAP